MRDKEEQAVKTMMNQGYQLRVSLNPSDLKPHSSDLVHPDVAVENVEN